MFKTLKFLKPTFCAKSMNWGDLYPIYRSRKERGKLKIKKYKRMLLSFRNQEDKKT